LSDITAVGELTKKRIFLGLLSAILMLLVIAVVFYFYFLTGHPDTGFWRNVTVIIFSGVFLLTLLFFCGLFLITLAILKQRPIRSFAWLILRTLHLYPLVLQIGRFLTITQDKIQRSFIEVNNQLLSLNSAKTEAERILLILPHCLQNDECTVRVTRDISNCKHCGRCQVGDLWDLAVSKGVQTIIVTGGTLARQAVERIRPKLVVAVACERDLSSGVLDSFPLPVFGVLNERPQGPCVNTRVDLQKLESTLDYFIKP